jgi:FkbM family methyltransferase
MTMLAHGEYGVFEGADDDAVVLGSYERDGHWSPGLVGLLAEVLRGGGTLIDVGAHVGLIAIPVVARTGADCLAFEPEPQNAAFLRRNVEGHGLGARIEIVPRALHCATGRVRLALSGDNSGDHRVLAPGATADGRTTIEVEACTLDGWLDGRALARPVAIKLDTQGAEAHVLRGAQRTLRCVDHVVTEFWPAGLGRAGSRVDDLRVALAGFAWGRVLGAERPRAPIPIVEVFDSLAWIRSDGSDEGFFDVWFGREPAETCEPIPLDPAARMRHNPAP